MTKPEILTFIGQKLKDAEASLKCREEMARVWRGGTNKSWAAVGNTIGKSERLKVAAGHERIAIKLRREVELFQATLDELTKT